MADILKRLQTFYENADCNESLYDVGQAVVELKRLYAERRWIPVSERLPEDYDMVMLTDGDWVTFGCWSEISECWDVREDAEANGPRPLDRFTHWMPLPEPPA
jgi:hypothetical protein